MKSNVLINTDRLPLDSDNRKIAFTAIAGITALILGVFVFLTVISTNRFEISLPIVFLLSLAGFLFLKQVKKRISTGYISNDMVILKLLSGKNFVMEYACIKKAQAKYFLGISYCKIHFKFDGVAYTTYVFGKKDGNDCSQILSEAKRAYKEFKNKASHKPGSVHSAS